MPEGVEVKVRILKRMLSRELETIQALPSVDKDMLQNEYYLKMQLKTLEDNMKAAVNLDRQIVAMSEEDTPEFSNYTRERVYETLRDTYYMQVVRYNELLKSVCSLDNSSFDANSTQFSGHNSVTNLSSIKLPTIQIEPFDGSRDKWADFKDIYESSIHTNANLCNSTKLQYLQTFLKGEALRVIKRGSERLDPKNYNNIWESLVRRYEHKRSLVNSYFQMLFNQKSISKETSKDLKELHDITYDALSSLQTMGLNTDNWGDILVYIVSTKLPLHTRELWEEKIGVNDELPKFETFMKFIETRFRTLEGIEATRSQTNDHNNRKSIPRKTTLHTEVKKVNKPQTNNATKCKCCQKDAHYLFKCSKFRQLNVDDRIKVVNQHNYCYNCLGFHKLSECTSTSKCQTCQLRHHTLLHSDSRRSGSSRNNQNIPPTLSEGVQSTSDGRFSETMTTSSSKSRATVLFPTAIVNVINGNGYACKFRALIDACSDESYISERVVKKLQLPTQEEVVVTTGLGGVETMSSECVTTFTIQSLVQKDFFAKLSAYVIPKISSARPHNVMDSLTLSDDIRLADPNFNIPADIDILLGNSIDAQIAMSGCKKDPERNLVLKQTQLGWIVSGGQKRAQCFTIERNIQDPKISVPSLDHLLRKFWEIEEPPTIKLLTPYEKLAEKIYEATTRRLSSGKYMVSLPFKQQVHNFSNMRKIAMSRYLQIENKLLKDQERYNEYNNCLKDYIELNHMQEIDPNLYPNAYYIPHHCVIKECSTSTKLRVVFDASAKDSNMDSLNANLLCGPRLQDDLLDLLIRFRTHKYAFTADIQQMYRQIWINPNDRKFQVILWRPNINSPIKTYALNTVTFGTTSAPYLAVKTLTKLAKDERNTFPLGSKCLETGFYVDDFIHGADSVEEALQIQYETKGILQKAGFNLRKWSANDQRLLENISIEDRETKSLLSFEDIEQSVKTLGIHWSPADDLFQFKINVVEHVTHTKRTILSDIAKIFDPLGWLSPSTIIAKLLIQKLWLKQQDWDEPLSPELISEWLEFRDTLPSLQDIKLSRWLGTLKPQHIELHGFSDASEKAYAAAIYVRIRDNNSQPHLLISKTKVAPLKRVSLPRLELCAAQLLAKLMSHAKNVLKFENVSSYYWSDSTITLAWIKDSPHKRTTYVANRVSEIQSVSSPENWNHVPSQHNPADLGTRGILPSELQSNNLWWHGPFFLLNFDEKSIKSINSENVLLPEEENKKLKPVIEKPTQILESFLNCRKIPILETLTNITKLQSSSNDLLNKFSTLSKLCRVVAYCKRILSTNRKPHIHISPEEYDEALLTILRMVQAEVFSQEIQDLRKKKSLDKSSSILTLSPFLSEKDNLIRMNSRLVEADHLTYDQRFPIILPRNHFVSRLIARHAHISTLHGTSQQTIMLINQRYHIIRGSTLVKSVIHHCVCCFKFRCGTQSQQMAPLPSNRVSPTRPFQVCGVDLAGPFNLRKWKGRCNQFTKAYFAIFVCFATKAVHFEVVVDLSSLEFIAAYRRFISRRGTPSEMYSDCGTNFVGAEGVITRKKREYLEKWNQDMAKEMSEFHTKWHFNSPSAPHMGGLWEAGVKSAKHHIKRIVGNASLSYDEFETVLLQIEACMNSRPLTQVKDSPDQLVLTPGHFLIQAPLNVLPEQNFENSNVSHLDRWNYLQRLVQQIWKFWSQDYLTSLRDRKKWRQATKNVEVNDVVLIRDSNLPPTVWAKGLVTKIHPGKDGLVRVVTVKTKNTFIERPIVKLSPLPLNESN